MSGIFYKIDMFIVIDLKNIEKKFGKIISIIKLKDEVLFYVDVFEEFTFNFHFHAYEIYPLQKRQLINHRNLPIYTPCLSIKKENVHYFASRYAL